MERKYNDLLIREATIEDAEQLCIWWNDGKVMEHAGFPKGLGKVILSLFISTLFDEYGYKKVILDTNLNNKRAQHVYEQLGFKKVRINENSWKDQLGNWQSLVDYELTRECFAR